MNQRNSVTPKSKINISLKKILIYTGIIAIISGVIWKLIIGTSAGLLNPNNASALYTPADGQQLSGFNWTSILTVDHNQVVGNVNLIDFPLLVSLTLPQLKSVSNGGVVNNMNGYDIVFSGENNQQLDHEIEYYNPTTGEYRAWVRLPLLYHNVNTELSISCGNPSYQSNPTTQNTWSDEFEGVWHMDDNPTTSELIDAAGTYNGIPSSDMNASDVVQGKIGNSIDFDGSNDYFAIMDKYYEGVTAINQLTVTAWVKSTYNNNSSWNSNWSIIDFDRSEYFNFFVHGQGKASFSTKSSSINDFHGGSNGQMNDGNWHQMTGVYDGQKKYLYIDGILVNTKNNPHNNEPLGSDLKRFGFIGDGSEASSFNGTRNEIGFKGQLDEIRLLNIAKSPEWIATEYNNQSNPESFVSIGIGSSLPIELDYFTGELNENTVNLQWKVLSQRNNDYFIIEKSKDGIDYEAIGKIDGEGTTTKIKSYNLKDENPLIGLSYYRLKQADFDGKTEIFNAIAINYSPKVDRIQIESVYPNPFTNEFTIKYSLSNSGSIEMTLTNSQGRTVFSEQFYASEGQGIYHYQADQDLQNGLYILSIMQNGEEQTSTKLMKY